MHKNTSKKTITPESSLTTTHNQPENGEALSESIDGAEINVDAKHLMHDEFALRPSSGLQNDDIEHFVLFNLKRSLPKGIRNQIKKIGCFWNPMFSGWIIPLLNGYLIEQILTKNQIEYESKVVKVPKDLIPKEVKKANLNTYSEILLNQIYLKENELLKDVYRYDSSCRPGDFQNLPSKEGKTPITIQFETDFHQRYLELKSQKEKLNQINEIISDNSEKILTIGAPVDTVKSLIENIFSHQDIRTIQFCSNTFWQWNGSQYVELDHNKVRQLVYDFLDDAKVLTTGGDLKNFNPNQTKVNQIIDALKAQCFVDHHPESGAIWLDGRQTPNPKHIISFPNGILPIKSLLKEKPLMIPPTPQLLNTNCLNFNFDPSAEKPKEWIKFLEALWPKDAESQNLLQQWIGYVLTQDTKYQKILFIIGPPRSGKGTIGRVIEALLGTSNIAGPTLSSLSTDFGLQPLLNKKLIIISDVRLEKLRGYSITVERLLSISGEDLLTVNRKHQTQVSVQLPAKIMMMSNELPELRDSSGALANRYLILNLKTSWLGCEDVGLFEKFTAELPGILIWALEGLKTLQKKGYFIQPKSSLQVVEELRELTSPIIAFVDEMCEFDPKAQIFIKDLFKRWTEWCASNRYPIGNIQSFGKSFKAAFPQIEIKKTTRGKPREWFYTGITLNFLSTCPRTSVDI